MSTPASILIYGKDAGLLQTRQWVLEASGYDVWIATDLQEVGRIGEERELDLLILCHSLSPAACEQAVARIVAQKPNIRVLLLSAAGSKVPASFMNDLLEGLASPERLVATVVGLIGRSKGIPHRTGFDMVSEQNDGGSDARGSVTRA